MRHILRSMCVPRETKRLTRNQIKQYKYVASVQPVDIFFFCKRKKVNKIGSMLIQCTKKTNKQHAPHIPVPLKHSDNYHANMHASIYSLMNRTVVSSVIRLRRSGLFCISFRFRLTIRVETVDQCSVDTTGTSFLF